VATAASAAALLWVAMGDGYLKAPFSWRNLHTILSSSGTENTGTVTGEWSSALAPVAPL